jgi:hypothetical protein
MHRRKEKRNNQRIADLSNQLCGLPANFAIFLVFFLEPPQRSETMLNWKYRNRLQ